MPPPSLVETPSARDTGLRGRKLLFSSPPATDKVKSKRPITVASTKKEIIVEKVSVRAPIQRKGKGVPIKEPIELVDITTPLENPTFKRINKKFKEARTEIAKLKREEFLEKKKLSDLMDMYHGTLEKDKFIEKIFRPLHKHLRNLYKHNMAYQSQIRGLKMELQPFREEMAKNNLDLLAKDATRRRSKVKK